MNRREMIFAAGISIATLTTSDTANSGESDSIEAAKAVIRDHERNARNGKLDEIVVNFSDDVVLFSPGAELVQGAESFRAFYSSLLEMGDWDFSHHFSGLDIQGEAVIAYGVAKGTLVPTDAESVSFANNFLLVLRPEGGRYNIWRGAFAPAA